jgi:signal transduction histidine kinase
MDSSRLYAAAREAIRARDDFLVLASHELRTPLASLQLNADAVRRHGQRVGDEVIATRGDAISRQVGRLAALFDQIDEALRIRSEGVRLELETFDLTPLVESSAKSLAQQAGSSSKIRFRAEEPLVGRWDRRRVEQLIAVLIGNAVKFGAGEPIDVDLRKVGSSAAIIVRDYGQGIATDRLPAIFSPFERAVPKENFGGLGLGLYIARAIVEAHGGTIAVQSAPGEGATFEVRLPIANG